MRVRTFVLTAGAICASVCAFGEISHWRANRRELGDADTGGSSRERGLEAIVVLGYRNPRDRANHLNRYRVRAGIRSIDPHALDSVLVLCGGPTAGATPEAMLMERFARDDLGFTGRIRLEPDSRSTWENVENAIPLIEDAQSIVIVSNSIHAQKARMLLRWLRPDLARRLRRGAEHSFGELPLVKPVAAALGLINLRQTINQWERINQRQTGNLRQTSIGRS